MQIIVFEDSLVEQLEPLSLARPAYSLVCGSLSLADWLNQQDRPIRGLVRPHLEAWQAAEQPGFNRETRDGWRLLVNARLVPCPTTFETLRRLERMGEPGLVFQGETLAAGLLPPSAPDLDDPWRAEAFEEFLRDPRIESLPVLEAPLPLVNYAHDLIRSHLDVLGDNLQWRLESGRYREVRDGVFVAQNVELAEWVHVDSSQGPIVVDAGAVVRPFACLRGPLYLGPMSRVNEHALLKSGVSVGPQAKVGGEVEASVIEACSSKQHLGYLGHSYVGQWVNLGAGTSNSNLKNTYGSIRIEVGDRRVDTGLQFLGCIVGDMTRTAINTSIFTGKLIGTCSALYGFITTNVPSFVNYARSFGEITELSPAVMVELQKRVFLRRGIQQQDWHRQLLHDVYNRVALGRQLADRPVSL
jgi:glucose-1-phosphate thymidylyltransferase